MVLTDAELSGTQVLAGLGGVGKTQLAADHAHRLWARQKLDLLAWIPASSRRDVQIAYAAIAERVLHSPAPGSRPPGDAVSRFLHWLAETQQRWLIVLDDLVEPNDLRGLWPPHSPTGQVLVTTRRRDAALSVDHRQVLDVGLYTDSEAAGYLVDRLPGRARTRAQREEIVGLAADLGRLPLALAQAAAYLADRPLLTCADYRGRLAARRTSLAAVLPIERELPDEQHQTVAATWSLSIERADRLEPAGLARPILELLSLLDAAGVPAQLLATSAVCSYLAGRLARPITPAQVEDAIGCLFRLSLVSVDTGQPARAVRIHALVQRVSRESLNDAELATIADVAVDAILELWPTKGYELHTPLRSNVSALLRNARGYLCSSNARQLLLLVSEDLTKQRLYVGTFLQEILDELVQHHGAHHPDILTIRSHLASCHAEAGEFDRAANQAEKVLAGRLHVLGTDHADTLSTRHNIALWHARAGHQDEALATLDKLVLTHTKVFGPADKRTLIARLERAIARSESGDPTTAVIELKQVLTDQITLLGPTDRLPLYTRAQLINVRTQAAQYVRAAAEFEQLIADRIRTFAPCESIVPILDSFLTSKYTRQDLGRGWTIRRTELMLDVQGIPYRSNYRYILGIYDGIHQNAAYHKKPAIKALSALLSDALYAWGSRSPLPLAMRHNLAKWLGWAGDNVGSIVEWELLAADELHILGADHPDTQATRESLRGLDEIREACRPVQLWQRRRHRQLALNPNHKRPKRWPSRTPVDEALQTIRTSGTWLAD